MARRADRTIGAGDRTMSLSRKLHGKYLDHKPAIFLSSIFMMTKFLTLFFVIGLASISIAQAQSPAPAESPAPAKKHRTHKKAEATASPAESATSPSAAESPAASPKAKRASRKAKAQTAASSAVSPAASASPAKKTLADYFKPQASASPAGNPAPARGAGAVAAANATVAPGGGRGLVWVNTETHVYHKEGARFYGKTKKGKYVTEQEAIREGDKAAKRE